MKSSELGVRPSAFQLVCGDDLPDVDFIQEGLRKIGHEIVDLDEYRPPACSWRNGIGTLVFRVNVDLDSLSRLPLLVLRCEPNECEHLITDDGAVFFRLWWD